MTLEAAIRAGDLAAAIELLRSGANASRRGPDGMTPLMIASGLGQVQMVDLLLTAGAQVLAVEPRAGATALHKAALSGNPDVAGLLLDHGAFINQQSPILGHTPLMDAVVYKHGDVARLLLKRGARTAIRNHWHETALDIAAREGHADIARALLEAGANPRRVIGLFLGTALHEACYFGHADVVREMTEKPRHAGAPAPELDAQGPYNGMTPLHDAVWHGHGEAARALVDAGHPLDLRTHAGLTARELAVLYGYDDLARFLAKAEQA